MGDREVFDRVIPDTEDRKAQEKKLELHKYSDLRIFKELGRCLSLRLTKYKGYSKTSSNSASKKTSFTITELELISKKVYLFHPPYQYKNFSVVAVNWIMQNAQINKHEPTRVSGEENIVSKAKEVKTLSEFVKIPFF
jgi:hypothetical protein